MNEKQLLNYLNRQPKKDLLTLLQRAWKEMTVEQKNKVFGDTLRESPTPPVKSKDLLNRIKTFHADSLAGKYYAPFNITSKNSMRIPKKTNEWCDTIDDLLEECAKLTEEGNHSSATEGFGLLFELIEEMEYGGEIVFADECGSWMINADLKMCTAAYLKSLSATASTEVFVDVAIHLILRDELNSFSDKVYESAIRVSNKEQRKCLKAAIEQQKVRISSKIKPWDTKSPRSV